MRFWLQVEFNMKYILASNSPRRKMLLEQFINDLEIMPSEVQEKISKNISPEALVMSFAYQKAFEISNKVLEDSIVIGADTIVYKDEILMKPKDKNEAKKMLGKLSGESHFVYTGIAVINTNKEFKYVDYEVTKVKFRKLDSEMIDRYIDSNEPMDKAGSYGIQGLGSVLIEGIEGDYNNVVGLPIAKLDKILKKHLNISLL